MKEVRFLYVLNESELTASKGTHFRNGLTIIDKMLRKAIDEHRKSVKIILTKCSKKEDETEKTFQQ